LDKRNELELNNDSIYELIDFILKIDEQYPYSNIFYKLLFKKIRDQKLFGKLVDHMILLCNSTILSIESVASLLKNTVDFGFKNAEDRKVFFGLWLETLEDLRPDLKEIILYQMKLDVERRFEDKQEYLSRDYEQVRFENRDHSDRIVVQGICKSCNKDSVVVISYIEYRKKFADYGDPIKLNCDMCKATDSFSITLNQ
jgi:hypothetical protein